MPGAYTHITMANVAGERSSLQTIEGFPREAILACSQFRGYCELGAVSPDYPYLKLGSAAAAEWADTMHYERTGEIIKSAIRQVRGLAGDRQRKCLAWLLGYTAHVVMDVTIHPVVNLRVGDYAANKRMHRVCEMNQDVFIFGSKMNLAVSYAEHLDNGIGRCSNADDNLDDDIVIIWRNALEEVHGQLFARNAPDPAEWHSRFRGIVDGIAESRILANISRHIAPDIGFFYPSSDELDRSFIDDLSVPGGERKHFGEIFDLAKAHVQRTWLAVAKGALGVDDEFEQVIGNWNLDTGLDENNRLVFWDA